MLGNRASYEYALRCPVEKFLPTRYSLLSRFYYVELFVLFCKAKTNFLHIVTGITKYDNIITNYDRTSGLFPNGKCGIYFAHSRTAAGTDQIPY